MNKEDEESDKEADGDLGEPAQKKAKVEAGGAAASSGGAGSSAAGDGDQEEFIELDTKKRASVSTYQGHTFLGIREFYKDRESGEMRPSIRMMTGRNRKSQ